MKVEEELDTYDVYKEASYYHEKYIRCNSPCFTIHDVKMFLEGKIETLKEFFLGNLAFAHLEESVQYAVKEVQRRFTMKQKEQLEEILRKHGYKQKQENIWEKQGTEVKITDRVIIITHGKHFNAWFDIRFFEVEQLYEFEYHPVWHYYVLAEGEVFAKPLKKPVARIKYYKYDNLYIKWYFDEPDAEIYYLDRAVMPDRSWRIEKTIKPTPTKQTPLEIIQKIL